MSLRILASVRLGLCSSMWVAAAALASIAFGTSAQPVQAQAAQGAQSVPPTQADQGGQSAPTVQAGASTQPAPPADVEKEALDAAAEYIATHAEREERLRIPMRDGVRLSTTLLFPKGVPRQNLPTVLVFNPYLTERMIRSNGRFFQSFLKNGYAVSLTNSRGRYFSEGTFTFLGGSGKDGYDTIDWISKQTWSNGKVGTLGCSSSAEEQHKMNAMQHPAHAAAVPMGSGAGIGKVGPYNEMGNFYRGGAIQNFWYSWYRGSGYTYKPSFPRELSQEDLNRVTRYWAKLEPTDMPDARFDETIWTLPVNKIMAAVGAMPSDLDDFVNRLPNDPRWNEVEFGGEGDRSGAPTLYINSWYDVSIGPNTAMYEYQAKNAANETARNNMFMVIAPTLHCQQGRMESEHTIIGDRDMGDARLDYVNLVQRWFDRWLKGVDNGVTKEPKVRAYLMGANKWRTYDAWPPRNSRAVTYYLESDGSANSRNGNGRLVLGAPRRAGLDRYTYDPLHPTPTVGGQVCCFSAAIPGSFDQSTVQLRKDVLVYTSPPLTEPLEVTGPIKVSLYLSSDVKDTDLLAKLVDVYPDGRAFNLDEGVLRVRWREGYEKPVFMEPDPVYRVDIPPLVTSNSFGVGHRIQIAVTSSSFPQFERNLNTGGNNFDEKEPTIAHNVIHHGPRYPSRVVLPVVRAQR